MSLRGSLLFTLFDDCFPLSCLIVKTDIYDSNQIAKVLQLRANVEGLRLDTGVIERLVQEGDTRSLRYVLQLLTPASILASLAGRSQIELEDVSELDELFYDAKHLRC
jgi:RuvB-like protein 1 (pontin 52)